MSWPIHRLAVLLLASAFLNGCHHIPLKEPGRGALPLPQEIEDRLRPKQPARGFQMELAAANPSYSRYLFRFQSVFNEGQEPREVAGEYYRAAGATRDAPAPLIENSPILAGARDDYLACRVFAAWAAKEGFSSFFVHQEEDVLTPERQGLELERRLVEATQENILALDCLSRLPEVDSKRLGSIGISLGAIKNVLLIAAEPRLKANVLCLAGGDLPRIIERSRESLVVDYVKARTKLEGKTKAAIIEDLRRHLRSDPMALAPYVDPRRVLIFLGSLDDKVPYPTGLALHRALGEPELYVYPFGHYTGMLVSMRAATVGFAWMKERFAR
ncbi:MAG: hypothetical protein HY717_01950 [Planctomycetes bacterium]|nr:hypothetical protein [Planctomycetota bacterium]